MNSLFWKNKTVFLTGYTGFKGYWLSLWLNDMGAGVYGYALEPSTAPNLFTEALIEKHLASSIIADARDAVSIQSAMQAAKPDIVIHMAACLCGAGSRCGKARLGMAS